MDNKIVYFYFFVQRCSAAFFCFHVSHFIDNSENEFRKVLNFRRKQAHRNFQYYSYKLGFLFFMLGFILLVFDSFLMTHLQNWGWLVYLLVLKVEFILSSSHLTDSRVPRSDSVSQKLSFFRGKLGRLKNVQFIRETAFWDWSVAVNINILMKSTWVCFRASEFVKTSKGKFSDLYCCSLTL